MKIISPFHDYYDCIMAQDEDRETFYLRKPEEITFDTRQWPFPFWDSGKHGFPPEIIGDLTIVGFCGRIYPILDFTRYDNDTWRYERCRTFEQVDKYFNNILRKDALAKYKGEGRYAPKRRQKHRYYEYHSCRDSFKQFFDECAEKQDKYTNLFQEKRCPVFIAIRKRMDSHIVWNGSLKDVEFFRVFKPEQAYQEILMFVNNLAVPMKQIPVLDDVTKAEIHGFDRFSFRKDATKRRR